MPIEETFPDFLTKPIPSAVHDVWIGLVSSLVVTRYRPRSGHRGLYRPGLSGGGVGDGDETCGAVETVRKIPNTPTKESI